MSTTSTSSSSEYPVLLMISLHRRMIGCRPKPHCLWQFLRKMRFPIECCRRLNQVRNIDRHSDLPPFSNTRKGLFKLPFARIIFTGSGMAQGGSQISPSCVPSFSIFSSYGSLFPRRHNLCLNHRPKDIVRYRRSSNQYSHYNRRLWE